MQPHDATETSEASATERGSDGALAAPTTVLTRVLRGVPDERAEAPAIARALLASIFLASAYTKLAAWSYNVGYVETAGLPLPELALGLSVGVELVAGLALVLGVRPWTASLLLAGYLVPTSLLFHQFWTVGPEAFAPQLLQFAKNVAIVGGLSGIVLSGADGLATDRPDAGGDAR